MPPFIATDPDYLHMLDIVATNYGKLPSEVAKLPWDEIALCVAALRTRSERIDRIMKKTGRKKTAIFPTINLTDMINCL